MRWMVSVVSVAALSGCAMMEMGKASGRYGSAEYADDAATVTEPAPDTGSLETACDDVTPVALYLSPDDSNSMSSPVQARLAVLDGWNNLSGVPLRTWEFLNYYSFAYPPAPADTIGLHVEMVPGEATDTWTLQIGLPSERVADGDRAPMNLTFVVDTSGSMGGRPIALTRELGRAVVSKLVPGDVVSMVTWNDKNNVILSGHVIASPNDPQVVEAFEDLKTGGSTDLHGGLVAGYALAQENHQSGRINRVLLVSDGGANVGETDGEIIAEHAGSNDEDGIYMVGVGVGSASSYHDLLMDTVTDIGKGASVFIGDEAEAWTMFGERFVNTLDVAARDVRIRMDLPPGFEIQEFSGEEYSADPSEIEPQHLAPNDAMVFYQTLETCAPELVGDATEITVHASYRDAVTFEEREVSRTFTFGQLLAGKATLLRKGSAVYHYAEALKAASDPSTGDEALRDAWEALEVAEAIYPEDADLVEIRTVLEAL